MKHIDHLGARPFKTFDDGSTFEEERREVLESAFEALSRHPPNPDEMAACAYLMRHLTAGADWGNP